MSLDVGALYEQHAHQVAGFVRGRMTGAAEMDADDVTHLVWERALRAAGRYRPDAHPMAWLLTIARNAVTDYYRSSRWKRRDLIRNTSPISDDGSLVDFRMSADDVRMHAREPMAADTYPSDHADLAAALADLTPPQRAVVDLHYWDALPFAAIAERIGTTENGVKKLAIRARKRMRRYLEAAA